MTPAEGIIAQYGHLLAYALPKGDGSFVQRAIALLSPRVLVLDRLGWRGIAPTWDKLAGRWATDKDYWVKIQRVAREINPAFQA